MFCKIVIFRISLWDSLRNLSEFTTLQLRLPDFWSTFSILNLIFESHFGQSSNTSYHFDIDITPRLHELLVFRKRTHFPVRMCDQWNNETELHRPLRTEYTWHDTVNKAYHSGKIRMRNVSCPTSQKRVKLHQFTLKMSHYNYRILSRRYTQLTH